MEATIISLLLAAVLLVVLIVTAAADSALRAINQVQLRSLLDPAGTRRPRAHDRLLLHPHQLASSTLLLNTCALLALALLADRSAEQLSSASGAGRTTATSAILVAGLLLIALTQLVTQALALRNPERLALRIAGPLALFHRVLRPITWVVDGVAGYFGRVLGIANEPRSDLLTKEDLTRYVALDAAETGLDDAERRLIAAVLHFSDVEVHDVMVPRPDIVALASTLTAREALKVALEAGHSRLPVHGESMDEILGVVYTKDLAGALLHDDRRPLAEIARSVPFIPEIRGLAGLLNELRSLRVHVAIVVDEYGGTAGLVTIEDLLEEIVGEIHDEYDPEQTDVKKSGPNEWTVEARTDLDEINELLDVSLNSEDYDSLGGYITTRLGRLPVVGDEVEEQGVQMRVLETERNRIGAVRLSKVEPKPPEEAQDH